MVVSDQEARVYSVLESLGIEYSTYTHPPVFTIEEAKKYWGDLKGSHCKNLFLRNKRGSCHYLVILEQSKVADIKSLTSKLREDRLSFASPERLMRYLGLETGAVSPFGLINDSSREVRVVFDQELRGAERIFFHPNVNTATVGISFSDLERFLDWCGSHTQYLSFE